jgi:glycosyltransferase involved in cell wall biosynthesis
LARIAINTRFLLPGKLEGFGWYTYEVTKRITEQHPEHDFFLFFDRPVDKSFVFGKNVTKIVLQPAARHPFLFILWFDLLIPRALKKYKIDLFFSPDGYLSLRTSIPQIGTIHDISFEHFPNDIPRLPQWYLKKYFPLFARKASHILTVSEFSKQDICKKYQIDPLKITAVWNGASATFHPLEEDQIKSVRNKYSSGKPYFLFVGSIHPRKNLKRLIQAFAIYCQDQHNDWDLVIVGAAMWANSADFDIQENLKNRIHFAGRLEQEELVKIMASAGALTYVPYFEGFGIPLAEAMKCGTPILSGDRSCLPEVAGDAAIYCDPFDIESITKGLEAISSDIELRKDLSRKGLERAQLFDWDKTATEVWKTFEKILGGTSDNTEK